MSPFELVRLAFARLRASPLRAGLTMLGVVIGVASVVALVGAGEGATRGVTAQLQSLGTNLLTVNPGRATSGPTAGEPGSAKTLTLGDAAAIAGLPHVAATAPEIVTIQTVVAGAKSTTTTIDGTTASYARVHNESVWQGSFLTPAADANALRVAVLGATTAGNLGLGASAIGTDVQVGGLPFRVVGILQPKGGAGGLNLDDKVLIPLTTLRADFAGGTSVGAIGLSVSSTGRMDAVTGAITALLRQRHGLIGGLPDDFVVLNQAQLLGAVSSVSGLLGVLLGGIASISLLVGGIGIMNIMLVSVRERTREIGIRKAIGARSRDVLLQFLVEALALSLLGGAVGAILGLITSAAVGRVAGWGFVFSPLTLVVAAAFSAAVGVAFGVWPARQAARLDPIAALRYE